MPRTPPPKFGILVGFLSTVFFDEVEAEGALAASGNRETRAASNFENKFNLFFSLSGLGNAEQFTLYFFSSAASYNITML